MEQMEYSSQQITHTVRARIGSKRTRHKTMMKHKNAA